MRMFIPRGKWRLSQLTESEQQALLQSSDGTPGTSSGTAVSDISTPKRPRKTGKGVARQESSQVESGQQK